MPATRIHCCVLQSWMNDGFFGGPILSLSGFGLLLSTVNVLSALPSPLQRFFYPAAGGRLNADHLPTSPLPPPVRCVVFGWCGKRLSGWAWFPRWPNERPCSKHDEHTTSAFCWQKTRNALVTLLLNGAEKRALSLSG